jgi:hypothetical protein
MSGTSMDGSAGYVAGVIGPLLSGRDEPDEPDDGGHSEEQDSPMTKLLNRVDSPLSEILRIESVING